MLAGGEIRQAFTLREHLRGGGSPRPGGGRTRGDLAHRSHRSGRAHLQGPSAGRGDDMTAPGAPTKPRREPRADRSRTARPREEVRSATRDMGDVITGDPDMGRLYALFVLAWALIRSLAAGLLGTRRGLADFRRSYAAGAGLPQLSCSPPDWIRL